MTGRPFLQPSLFKDTAGPARNSDPESSHEAAALPGRSTQRQRVLRALLLYGPMRDETLGKLLLIDKGSASKRRQELTTLGLVEHAIDGDGQPRFEKTSHNARARVWAITMTGRALAMGEQ